MKIIRTTIEGITPLLLNRFTDEAQLKATNGSTGTYQKHLDPADDAESRLYKDESGTIVMPQPNLLRCLIDAGKFFKAGKTKVTTLKSSLIPACVTIEEMYCEIVSRKGWTVDQRPIRNPATGGRLLRYRPMFHDWLICFTMILDTEILSTKQLREIVDGAGKRIGLGDFRPDCKGPFGKFVVTFWEEQDA